MCILLHTPCKLSTGEAAATRISVRCSAVNDGSEVSDSVPAEPPSGEGAGDRGPARRGEVPCLRAHRRGPPAGCACVPGRGAPAAAAP